MDWLSFSRWREKVPVGRMRALFAERLRSRHVTAQQVRPVPLKPGLRVSKQSFRAFDAFEHRLGFQQITRSEEHTSELQSLMRISYAVFCLKKKKKPRKVIQKHTNQHIQAEKISAQ